MRVLVLFRGAMGCGKSTFIEVNGLKPYTLCADDVRMLCQSPVLSVDCDGGYTISQQNDKLTWKIMFELLENRMKRGEFTVIDATNTKTSEMNKYKKLADKYRYRIYCVDMTDVPIEVAKERNFKRRPLYKRVPTEAIDRAYARFANQKVPAGIKVIKPEELDTIYYHSIDLSGYDNIHVIGDVHGCYTALKEFMDKYINNPNDYFIFVGDYLDRGIENADVMKYLIDLHKNNKNVVFLEGNHETHLRSWANDYPVYSNRFKKFTAKELEGANIKKKDVRQFCRSLAQCAYFTYKGHNVLVTHGGLTKSLAPHELTFTATEQMINGVGDYGDEGDVAYLFRKNVSPSFEHQVHGHRNVNKSLMTEDGKTFNLCDDVEWGGYLRAVTFTTDDEGEFDAKEHYIRNNVFKIPPNITMQSKEVENKDVKDIVEVMRASKNVREKKFGNISSFNFTRQAFEKGIWDGITVKARGLFIDTDKYKVVIRGYDKFFNFNENNITSEYSLKRTLKFPVRVYVKENGFLGLFSADDNCNPVFASKSTIGGEFANIFKENMYEIYGEECIKKITEFCHKNNTTMVFECIDTKRDPHIIKYKKNECILLDIIYNDIKFKKLSYDDMCEVAMECGLENKYLDRVIYTYDELMDYIKFIEKPHFVAKTDRIDDECLEGYVFEDVNGFMFKLKTPYYRDWKLMRKVATSTLHKGHYPYTGQLITTESNKFYGWLLKKYRDFIEANDKEGRYNLMNTNIITLREMYKGEMEDE